MRRPIRYFALFAGATAALFRVATTAGGLVGFLAGAAAAACAAAAWATAVLMASVHRVTWPLILSTVGVAVAALLFLISRG